MATRSSILWPLSHQGYRLQGVVCEAVPHGSLLARSGPSPNSLYIIVIIGGLSRERSGSWRLLPARPAPATLARPAGLPLLPARRVHETGKLRLWCRGACQDNAEEELLGAAKDGDLYCLARFRRLERDAQGGARGDPCSAESDYDVTWLDS